MKYHYTVGVRKSLSKKIVALLASIALIITPLFNTVATLLPGHADALTNVSLLPAGNFEATSDFAGWTSHDTNWGIISDSGAQDGSKYAQAKADSGSLVTTIDTTGKENINLSYFYKLKGLDPSSAILVSYSINNGSSWTPIDTHTGQTGDNDDSTAWVKSQNTLSTAANNPSVLIKFNAVFDTSNNEFDLDTISVTGTTITVPAPGAVASTAFGAQSTQTAVMSAAPVAQTSSTETVSQNTATGENQPGWLFNRDTSTASPFEFNKDAASIGSGSLYVKPIGVNPSDKFIAENFVKAPIADINNISYDYKIGSGGSASDSNQFYMNVYANFASSDANKYYDCKYDVVPAGGSVANFSTVTFNPAQNYAVQTRTGGSASPHTCPSSPAAMNSIEAGSTIRAIAINLGDTTTSDVGLDGYFDKVVIDKTATKVTSDFEPIAPEACNSSTFDAFSLGSVNGQAGWKSTGNYDQEVVDNTYGFAGFGCKTLRLSNARTTGSFGDQTFSDTTAPAGESSTSTVNDHYEASFDIASTKPNEQTNLALSISPDDGTGNRMSYLRLEDRADGVHVFFDDVSGTSEATLSFDETEIATLSRTQPHTIKFVIDYKDGASNDVVKVLIDGVEKISGTSWENYYRYATEQLGNGNQVPSADRLLFRSAGAAVPANQGNGFLFDNVAVSSRVNNVVPTLTVVNPAENSSVSTSANSNQLKITGSFTDDVKANYATFQLVRSGSSVAIGTLYGYGSVFNPTATYANADDSYTYNLAVPAGLEDGVYSLFYVGTDFAGGVTERMERKFTIDNTAPTVPTNLQLKAQSNGAAIANNSFTNVKSVTADWNGSTDTDHYIYKIWDNIAGTAYNSEAAAYTTNVSNTSRNGDFNQGDGTYYVQIAAVDALGNTSAFSDTFTITYDSQVPVVAITNPTANQVLSVNSTNKILTISGTAKDDSNFNYYYCYVTINGGGEVGVRDPKCQTAWAAGTPFKTAFSEATNGTTTSTLGAVDLTGVADGSYTVHVVAKDKAGNTTEATQNFTLDNTAPVITIVDQTSSSATPTITGSVFTPNSTVVVRVNNVDYTATVDPNGIFTALITNPLPNGSYPVTITANDGNGNTSTDTSRSITVAVAAIGGGGNTTPGTPGSSGQPASTPTTFTAPAVTGLSAIPLSNFGLIATNNNAANAPAATAPTDTTQTPDNQGDVLGAQDFGATDNSAVKGDTATKSPFEIFGITWYWIVAAIVAAAAFAWWFLLAAKRRRKNDQKTV